MSESLFRALSTSTHPTCTHLLSTAQWWVALLGIYSEITQEKVPILIELMCQHRKIKYRKVQYSEVPEGVTLRTQREQQEGNCFHRNKIFFTKGTSEQKL